MFTTRYTMNSADSVAGSPENPYVEPSLKVLIVYNDAAVGRRAMGVLLKLAAHSAEPVRVAPTLYRFELLDDPHWRELAAADAADSDMIILSTSVADELPETVNAWAKASLARRGGASTAMLTLFGSQEAWTVWIQDKSHVHTVRQSPVIPTPQVHHVEMIAACA